MSCGGKIEKLDLRPSNSNYDVRLWQSNTQYCTVGIIRCVSPSETIKVSEFLKKNHPGAMLYGTKNGGAAAERISGDTRIDKDGVGGVTYTNLYIQTCEKHEPTSETDLKCKYCGAALVVKISAVKDGTEQVGYFPRDSKDSVTWSSGYAEAAAQLTKWVAEGYTDAKLFPLNDNAYSIPVTCKMTLVGTGHKYINVTVKDGADVLLEGGEYEYITVDGGKATIPAVKCKKVTVNGGKVTLHNECVTGGVKITGGEAIFESGTYDDTFEMNGGTVTVKDGVTFTKNYNLAFQVTKGTLNVEGGTITGGVSIENPVNLTISGGTFKQAVTITRDNDSTAGTCSISGGTFEDKLTLYKSAHNLSALLAEGCAYYQGDIIANGEVTELRNVTVKNGHTHIIDADTGECSVCKAKMEASVTVGDTTTYYETIGAAVAALNAAGDGARTLKLFQGINNSSEVYTLTNGPVTLDLNGKEFWGKPFIAQGITLTLKSEKAGGSVAAVRAIGNGSKIIANSTNIENDGNLTVREISAEKGGQLELSTGTFLDLYVVKDGSSASLSGGLYEPRSYPYGGGPEDKNGTSGKYVGAWDLLPKGYRYKEKQSNGSFSWVSNNSFKISTNETYTVANAGASFEKIYPDSKTDFTGDTYVVTADETGGSLTLTAKVTSPGKAQYDWRVMYQKDDGTGWDTVGGSNDPNKGKATYTGKDAATLTISNLPVGTHQYSLGYWLYDSEGKNYVLTGSSEPLTVVVTKHEHSWKYELKEGTTDTITAKCTADGCYLTDKLGGTFTISAPAADTLTYDGSAKEAAAKLDAVSGVTSLPTVGGITYAQNGKTLPSAPVNAGEYTASITVGEGENAATANVEYTIAQAELSISGATAISRGYVQNDKSVGISGVTFIGASLTKDTDYTVTGEMDNANAGIDKNVNVTVTLTGSATTNYTLTLNTTTTKATIYQIDPTTPTGLTGLKDQALSTVTLLDGWTWDNPNTTMSTSGNRIFKASYAGSTNYKAKANVDVTVTVSDKKLVTISGLTATTGLTYNGSVQTGYTGTASYSPAWSGTPVVTYYLNDGTTKTTTANSGAVGEGQAPKNAGNYKVTIAIPDSDLTHTGHVTLDFAIAKRTISVKADNKSMTVNGTLPTFTVTYGNFASGDSEAAVIETKATAFCTADGASTGSFPITVSGTTALKSGMDTNYEVGTPESGTLTVNPRSSGGGGGGGGGGASVPTFTVTAPAKTDNGSVSVSPKNAAAGDTVTVTVTPDKGYTLETLTVLDKNGKELKLTEKNGKYTFTMPAGKVEVKVTFMDDNTMLNFFVDVKADNYFYDAVKWAAEKGITSGTDDTHFSPNAACTRAQIVTFLWRAAGSPEPKGTGSFADVSADSYYAKAVAWAVENGITGGTGDGKFSPNATCTREQAVAFLYRASGSPAVSGGSAFNDVAANAYYTDAVAWAEKNEITGGIGGGLFGSGNDCTRAQIVTFLYRTYQGK